MLKSAQRIASYVMEKLPDEPLQRRIQLTRDLASLAPTTAERRELLAIVSDLESAARRHEQLLLKFRGGES